MYHYPSLSTHPQTGGGSTHAAFQPLHPHTNHPVPYIARGGHPSITLLPNELLIKIFSYSEEGRGLMEVCRHWANVICATPHFWCDISVYRHLEWLVVCLQRSQQLPVDVTFYWANTNIAHALQLLMPHKDRITSLGFLEIDCAQIGDQVPPFGEMDRLKSLEVMVKHRHPAESTAHNGACPSLTVMSPSLEKLSVRGVALRGLNAESFSSLRELSIAECEVGTEFSYDATEFVEILNACSHLETLFLGKAVLEAICFDDNEGPRAVMPHLRDLQMEGAAEDISDMLSRMEVKDTVDVWLETYVREDVESTASVPWDILPSDIPSCGLGILKSATRIMVDVPRDPPYEIMYITATQGMNMKHKLNIRIQAPLQDHIWTKDDELTSPDAKATYFLNALDFLPEMFPNAPLETLVCRGDVDQVDEETWRSVLSSFPMLKTLVIDDRPHFGDAAPLFHALRSEQSPDDPRPVCRSLEYLWILHASGELDSLEELRKCITWRTERLAPLKRLRLELCALEINSEHALVFEYKADFARLVPDSSVVIVDLNRVGGCLAYFGVNMEAEVPFGIMGDADEDVCMS